MKSLYDAGRADELKRRLAQLRPDSPRQWGTMSAAQALAHCCGSMQTATGDSRPPRMLAGRVFGGLARGKVLRDDAPLGRNSPTSPDLKVRDERDLDAERQRLSALIDHFAAAGPEGCTRHPHTFFGALTAEQWGILMYKHLDHHLRQFGA